MANPHSSKSRRLALFIAGAAVAVLGLALHFLAAGDAASLVADALYTVLVYLLFGFVAPAARRHRVALAAFAFSAVIEIAQLTGIPAQLGQAFPPSRLLLGTTFSALDLVAYAVGAAAACAADTALSRRAASRRGRAWLASRSE
ncbi:ribosomal maturation YjgA family protein [Arthrobacter sp. ERGS1:01]|uniref:ribosomal maturation YjgA family protein n=1 Tax=Arthrobacter sp. ERGS1:01 TaxID=1704044 RepID=UPI0006B57F95|nr:DUF2809 domain-containing protein [Arthrobacter sp. ERGS1:01]